MPFTPRRFPLFFLASEVPSPRDTPCQLDIPQLQAVLEQARATLDTVTAIEAALAGSPNDEELSQLVQTLHGGRMALPELLESALALQERRGWERAADELLASAGELNMEQLEQIVERGHSAGGDAQKLERVASLLSDGQRWRDETCVALRLACCSAGLPATGRSPSLPAFAYQTAHFGRRS